MHTRSFMAMSALLLAALGCRNDTTAPTDPGIPQPSATLATALSFWQLSGGAGWYPHTCGVTTDNRAYCWGNNGNGQVGNGGTSGEWPIELPTLVQGGLSFRQLDAGAYHTCGITITNKAYCWGFGHMLGNGSRIDRTTPTAVASSRSYRQVSTGEMHTCAVTTENRAYCWGYNAQGQLGDGTLTSRISPVAVLGGLSFKHVSAGDAHTCGVTTANQVYCWGANDHGQLGDSTSVSRRTRPYPVVGTRQYRLVEAGGLHTCAVATTNRAYCWGEGQSGELGFGKAYRSRWPRAVVGGLSFERVTAGGGHTCGLTTTNRAYCWGGNGSGQLGDGTTTSRLAPVAVSGGLSFRQVSAGAGYTCGKTIDSVGYCWGENDWYQLGDGSEYNRTTPTPVGSPHGSAGATPVRAKIAGATGLPTAAAWRTR